MAPCKITQDYHAILEVRQTATEENMKKSYHRQAKALHPDKNLDKPDATASFQGVSPWISVSCYGWRHLLA